MEERHDCQDLNCPDFQKQIVLDAMSMMLNQIFLEIDNGSFESPLDAIDKSLQFLRDGVADAGGGQTLH